jgi:DNA-binding MarR family transcriptional regulator
MSKIRSTKQSSGAQNLDSVQGMLDQWAEERPDLETDPLAIFGRLQRLSTHILRRSADWLEPLGLSWEAFSLIATLRRAGPPFAMRPTEIYKASLLSSGAVTNRVDRVEELGLVKRARDPEDRRGVVVTLTPKGKALADRAIDVHLGTLKTLFADLQPDEQGQLVSLLSKLLMHLEGA